MAHTTKGSLAVATTDGRFYHVSWSADAQRPFPAAQQATKIARGTEEQSHASALGKKRPAGQNGHEGACKPILQKVLASSAVFSLGGGQHVTELRYFGGGVLSKPALVMAHIAPSSLLMLDWRKQSVAKRLEDLRRLGSAADPIKSASFSCGAGAQWGPGAGSHLVLCAVSDTKASGAAKVRAVTEHLFSSLAGADGELAGRKLLLQGLEDGRVVCSVLPVGVRGGARLEKSGNALDWRTVLDIQEPVVALLGARLPSPDSKESNAHQPINFLVAVGSEGRIAVLLAGHKEMPLQRHVFHLRTSVTTAVCTDACRLVYLSQSSLHVVDLLDRSNTHQPQLSSILVPTSLPLAHRVVALQLAADEMVLAATTTGALLNLCLPSELRDLQQSNAELASPQHLQQNMKRLLKDITELAHQQEELARTQTFVEQEVAQVGAAINFAADLRSDPALLSCRLSLEPEPRGYKPAAEEALIPVSLLTELCYRGLTEVSSTSWSLLLRFRADGVVYSRSVELPALTRHCPVAIRVELWLDVRRPLLVEAFLCFACSGTDTCDRSPVGNISPAQPFAVMLASSSVTALDCLRPMGHKGTTAVTAMHGRIPSPFHCDRLHQFLHCLFLNDKKAGQRPGPAAANQSASWRMKVEAPLSSFLLAGEILALLSTGKHTTPLLQESSKWQLGPFGVQLDCAATKRRGGGLDRGVEVVAEAPSALAAGLASAVLLKLLGQASAYETLFVKKASASSKVSARTLVAVYARLLTHVDDLLAVRTKLEEPDMVAFLQGLCALDMRSSATALELARYTREQLSAYTSLRSFE